mmetsp:Transcript_47576/g.118961  ORF Transcript_47576/g.118961 Transcript_47576/m.118961 type:complete len:88 (-) Transcript_47576:784-1047(-)
MSCQPLRKGIQATREVSRPTERQTDTTDRQVMTSGLSSACVTVWFRDVNDPREIAQQEGCHHLACSSREGSGRNGTTPPQTHMTTFA